MRTQILLELRAHVFADPDPHSDPCQACDIVCTGLRFNSAVSTLNQIPEGEKCFLPLSQRRLNRRMLCRAGVPAWPYCSTEAVL